MKASEVKQVIVFDSPALESRASFDNLKRVFPNVEKIVYAFGKGHLDNSKPTVAIGYGKALKLLEENCDSWTICRWGLELRESLWKKGFPPWTTDRIRLADYEGKISSGHL